MTPANISDAVREFGAAIEVLDSAYWEASNIENKDTLYDVLSILNAELAELNKLSIQDHHYPYEMVTLDMPYVLPKLRRLRDKLADVVERTSTQARLAALLRNVILILEQQKNQKNWTEPD